MTLQYRTRDNTGDRNWQQRLRLTEALLLDTIDWWCRGNDGFPCEETVAGLLYIFSPHCAIFALPQIRLRDHFEAILSDPHEVAQLGWPSFSEAQRSAVIEELTAMLAGAATSWASESLAEPTLESVVKDIANCIVHHKCFVFHHTESTRRDGGGFHAAW